MGTTCPKIRSLTVKILTLNINSIRAHVESFMDILESGEYDTILVQELKCENACFPHNLFDSFGYNVNFIRRFLRRLKKLSEFNNALTRNLTALSRSKIDLAPNFRGELERFLSSQLKLIPRIKYALTSKAFKQKNWETIRAC